MDGRAGQVNQPGARHTQKEKQAQHALFIVMYARDFRHDLLIKAEAWHYKDRLWGVQLIDEGVKGLAEAGLDCLKGTALSFIFKWLPGWCDMRLIFQGRLPHFVFQRFVLPAVSGAVSMGGGFALSIRCIR